ncbi:hypothetical protein FRC11_011725, partial [Ceratobasidium sp. 423]
MLPSFFYKEEHMHILDHYPEWELYAGEGKLQSFWKRFPSRDITKHPNSPQAVSVKDRDKMTSRIQKILYAAANIDEAHDTSPAPKLKGISILSIFKQHYGPEILKLRDTLMTSDNDALKLVAYNKAVKQLMASLKEERPTEYEELVDAVEQMRVTANLAYDQQEPHVQESILEALPIEIKRTVKMWERRSGAAIYVIATWNNKNVKTKGFDVATKACGDFMKSDVAANLRMTWLEFVREPPTTGNAGVPVPSVYPGLGGQPMLPDVDHLNLWMPEEKML